MRLNRNYRISDSARLTLAGLFSLALHALLLFFVRYVQPPSTNFLSQTHPLQVMLENRSAEVVQPGGIPQASEDSAGEAKIGVQDKNFIPQKKLAAVDHEPGDQLITGILKGFLNQRVLSIDKPQQMTMAERGVSTPDLLVTPSPDHETPEPPENKEGAIAPAPSVAKPTTIATPSLERLVSPEPIPGERHEKIILVEPVHEKPASEKPGLGVDESKQAKFEEQHPVKAEEPKQASIEEVKSVRIEEAKSQRNEVAGETKKLSSEVGRQEAFRTKSPGYETSRQPVPGIPLIKKIALEDDKSTQPGARIKIIGFKEQDFRYVMYIEGLRLKLERIGFLNYPSGAAGESLSGTLSVKISIRSDGSLEDFSIVRPSKYQELNAGAEKIVRMSAPFSPLPENIRRDTDVLSITIKWTFSRSRQSFD